MVITSPEGTDEKFMYRLDVECSNNQAEYEALIIGLKMLKSLDAKVIQIMGDSQLVINQLLGEYRCNSPILEEYLGKAKTLLEHFADVSISHIPRASNEVANGLAQQASGYRLMLPEVNTIEEETTAHTDFESKKPADWRQELIQYLANPSAQVDYKLKQRALKYVLVDGELFRRSQEGMLLKCLGIEEALKVMGEVHEGICGAHKSGPNMK